MSDRSTDAGQPAPTKLLDLLHGKGLSPAETASITRRALTSIVLFAGTAESGKTTLLATLYLLFQRGPFAGYLFAGSETLVGFENRVYFARTASGRETPATPRTSVSEYLHLQVRREDLSEPVRDVLLCDLSGEDFREAKDNSDACRELKIISLADRFVLLIDGGKLARSEAKQSAKNDSLTILRNCLDTGMLGKESIIDVLITKWDIVETSDEKEVVVAFADHVESEIRRRAGGRVGHIRFTRVASHPFVGDLPLGHGLEELFPAWVEAAWDDAREHALITEAASLTEYDRYYRRRLPHLFVKG